ncbi:hypothetical protein F4821DRAFT_66662 [Hypoxylon rubiginosum]|uniref:Uncharacterized protein n=1 Tax=Hypoxylon rubiginosum TaxID=110542 RepID=A0ACC0D959_9PEZI|nr:hypothetical protein F4821DRAFT_66662 [Hypoxylon rubiginosum]
MISYPRQPSSGSGDFDSPIRRNGDLTTLSHLDLDPSSSSTNTNTNAYLSHIVPRPRSTEPSPRYGCSVASTRTIADLQEQLSAANTRVRDLFGELDHATRMIGRLSYHRREVALALDRSETNRRSEAFRAELAADMTRRVFQRHFQKAAITHDGDVYLPREPREPCAKCEGLAAAHAGRKAAEKEAAELRVQLGRANARIGQERDASRVITTQAESYQKLIVLQHQEIKQYVARMDGLRVVADRLRKENRELVVEKEEREKEMEKMKNAVADVDVDVIDGEEVDAPLEETNGPGDGVIFTLPLHLKRQE